MINILINILQFILTLCAIVVGVWALGVFVYALGSWRVSGHDRFWWRLCEHAKLTRILPELIHDARHGDVDTATWPSVAKIEDFHRRLGHRPTVD